LPISQHLQRADSQQGDRYPARLDSEKTPRRDKSWQTQGRPRSAPRQNHNSLCSPTGGNSKAKAKPGPPKPGRVKPGKRPPPDKLLNITPKEGQKHKLDESENFRAVDESVGPKLPDMDLSDSQLREKASTWKNHSALEARASV
jgi:hypothetical protein